MFLRGAAFGAADGRYSEAKSRDERQIQISGVGDPLTVTEQDIGFLSDFPVCFNKRRDFPEREQAGYIRESRPADMMDGLDRSRPGHLERYDDGNQELGMSGIGYIRCPDDFET